MSDDSLTLSIEREVFGLLESRGAGKSICPSEVARAFGGADWRGLMEPVREVGVRLALADRIEMTQRGEVVNPLDFRGPNRFRLKPSSDAG